MKLSIAIDISPPITYLGKFWFSSYGSKCCWPIELQDSLKCNLRKKWMMNFIFAMSRNIEIFYRLILPSWVCVSRHAQTTQNMKFAYLCNVSRRTWGDKVVLLPAHKYESFLQDDTIILGFCNQASPKYPKQQICNILPKSQGKQEEWSWFFACRKTSKISSNWYYRFRCVWPSMPKLLKITSLVEK